MSAKDVERSDVRSAPERVTETVDEECSLIPFALAPGTMLPFDVGSESFGLAASLSASCFFRASHTLTDGFAGEDAELGPAEVAVCVEGLGDALFGGGLERVDGTVGDDELLTPFAVGSAL